MILVCDPFFIIYHDYVDHPFFFYHTRTDEACIQINYVYITKHGALSKCPLEDYKKNSWNFIIDLPNVVNC